MEEKRIVFFPPICLMGLKTDSAFIAFYFIFKKTITEKVR